jgi:polyisoprenoid-binding protein YceI
VEGVMSHFRILIFAFGLWFSQSVFAEVKNFIPENPELQFIAIGKPAMLKIKGKSEDLKGKIKIDDKQWSANLLVNLSSLTTGIDVRDKHMKEKYLEVAKFPTAELTINNMKLIDSIEKIKNNQSDQEFKGELDLHGVKKPVSGFYSIESVDNKVKIVAKFTMNLSDFKIDIPTYIGIKVADKVDIETKFDLKK